MDYNITVKELKNVGFEDKIHDLIYINDVFCGEISSSDRSLALRQKIFKREGKNEYYATTYKTIKIVGDTRTFLINEYEFHPDDLGYSLVRIY